MTRRPQPSTVPETAARGIGDNAPPPKAPTKEQLQAQLEVNHDALAVRWEEIAKGWTRFLEQFPTITTEDVQAKASDFLDVMRKFVSACERAHGTEKEPWLLLGRTVDGHFNSLMFGAHPDAKLPVGSPAPKRRGDPQSPSMMVQLRQMMTDFALREEERKREAARLEAQRKAAEAQAALDAAEAAAAKNAPVEEVAEKLDAAAEQARVAERAQAHAEAPAAVHSRVHGEFGSHASLRTIWSWYESESDLMALVKAVAAGEAPLRYLDWNRTNIGTAVRSEKIHTIPGCAIREVKSI